MIRRFFLTLAFIIISLTSSAEVGTDKSSELEADKVEYFAEQDLIVATGKVEIYRDGYILKSDKLIFDQKENKIFAIGNVYSVDPEGNEAYAEKMEIDRNLKQAVLEAIKIRMADDTLFSANKAEFIYPSIAELERATYSPCVVCKEDKYPQWQLAAKRVEIDKKSERVSYNHGFFEIYGKPIFYTPYFSHPTPKSKPKSGFLVPKLRSTTTFGQGTYVPYYYRIADNKDLIFAPIFTSKQGIVYTAKYQHLTESSFYTVKSSYNKPKVKDKLDPNNHYYVNINGSTRLSDNWQLKNDLYRVSDKSYIRNYFGDNKNYLTSDAELLYVKDRDYATINSLYFQELRPTIEQKHVPIILPVADYHKEYTDSYNNRYSLDSNALLLGRKKGSSTKRLSLTGKWVRTHFTNNGQQITVNGTLRGDTYNFAHKHEATPQIFQNNNGPDNIARVIPQIETKWQYPFVSINRLGSFFIEPIVNVIANPNMNTISNIINEDSQQVEIGDDNLFSTNRYAGYDRVENGIRGAYGLNGYYVDPNGIFYDFLVGQAYHPRKDLNYTDDSGMSNKLSDTVGRLSTRPWKNLEILYRFRYDQKANTIRRNEVRTNLYVDPMSFTVGFVDYNYANKVDQDKVKKSIDFGTGLKISEHWSVNGAVKQNYTARSKFLVSSGGGLVYNGDCTNINFKVEKDFTHASERNFKKETSFTLEVHLKNIN